MAPMYISKLPFAVGQPAIATASPFATVTTGWYSLPKLRTQFGSTSSSQRSSCMCSLTYIITCAIATSIHCPRPVRSRW